MLSISDGMATQPQDSFGFLSGVSICCWAAVTGAVTPVLGHFFDHRQYERGFWLVAVLPVAGTLLWQSLRRREAK